MLISYYSVIGQNPEVSYWDKIPKQTGWINDFENIFTAEQERILYNLVYDYENRTSVEITVITIPKTATSEVDFDALTLKIAKTWGIGKKYKDNGILIGISKGHRIMRIQNGYGIEKIMTDILTMKIIDQIFIPNFKKEDYFKGTFDGIVSITNFLDLDSKSTYVNLNKTSVYQYIELLKINQDDSGNQHILSMLNHAPENWVTEKDIDSLMTYIHSTDPAKCVLNLSSLNPYLLDSSTIGGHIMDIIEAFKEGKSYSLSQTNCPMTDKKRIEMLELWWNEKKK